MAARRLIGAKPMVKKLRAKVPPKKKRATTQKSVAKPQARKKPKPKKPRLRPIDLKVLRRFEELNVDPTHRRCLPRSNARFGTEAA
jgi:hypothetical protein